MKLEEMPIHPLIVSNDGDAIEPILNDASIDFGAKNERGQTLLHIAVLTKADQATRLLLRKIPPTERDENGLSVSDYVKMGNAPVVIKGVVEDYVTELIRSSDVVALEKLLFDGHHKFNVLDSNGDPSMSGASEVVKKFVESIPEHRAKMEAIHRAAKADELEDVTKHCDNNYARSRDQTGKTPLHKATIYESSDIVQYLAESFPDAVNVTDNLGRSPLHYAAASRDGGHMYQILKAAGAREDLVDALEKTPQYYLENKASGELDLKDTRTRMDEIARRVSEIQRLPSVRRPLKVKTGPNKISGYRASKFIQQDTFAKKNVPPPTTVEGQYLAKQLGEALANALSEVADRRPWDPIEYLANWLYKHAENLKHSQQATAEAKELEVERAAAAATTAAAPSAGDEDH